MYPTNLLSPFYFYTSLLYIRLSSHLTLKEIKASKISTIGNVRYCTETERDRERVRWTLENSRINDFFWNHKQHFVINTFRGTGTRRRNSDSPRPRRGWYPISLHDRPTAYNNVLQHRGQRLGSLGLNWEIIVRYQLTLVVHPVLPPSPFHRLPRLHHLSLAPSVSHATKLAKLNACLPLQRPTKGILSRDTRTRQTERERELGKDKLVDSQGRNRSLR